MYNLSETVFGFLKQLKENNTREWFNSHKSHYEAAHRHMIEFADDLLSEMRKQDDIETGSGKMSLHRIYRDVRFSKDKKPYKCNWSGSFRRLSKMRRGGYYFHIEPGNTFIAGGFFAPNTEDLKLIRDHIDQDAEPLRKALENHETIGYFSRLSGDRLKTSPKGFAVNHPAIDLLKHKQFILKHSFTDKEACQKDFHKKMASGFKKMLPFFDVMSEYLTTDLNGIPLV